MLWPDRVRAQMLQWHAFFIWIERLGSLDTTALAALCALLALTRRGQQALALRYALAIGLALTIGVVSKMAYYGWGIRFGLGAFHGMSGHVLRAFAIWPALGFALTVGRSRMLEAFGVALGGLVAVGVTATIVGFRVHTPAEAIAGAVVGWLTSIWLLRHDWIPALGWRWTLALLIVAMFGCARIAAHPLTYYDYETRLARGARQIRAWTGAPPCKVRHGLVECDDGTRPPRR